MLWALAANGAGGTALRAGAIAAVQVFRTRPPALLSVRSAVE